MSEAPDLRAEALGRLVRSHLSSLVVRLRGEAIDDLVAALVPNAPPLGQTVPREVMVELIGQTMVQVETWRERIAAAAAEFTGFRDAWFGQPDRQARRTLAENALRFLGSDRSTPKADLAALDRHLDFEAFNERFVRRERDIQKRIEVAISFAARAAASVVTHPTTPYGVCLGLIEKLKIDAVLGRYAVHPEHPWAARLDVLEGLMAFYRGLGRRGLFDRASAVTLRRLLTLAGDVRSHPVLRGKAVEVATLLPADEGRPILTRAVQPRPGEASDGFIARRIAAHIIAERLPPRDAVTVLADRVWNPDPSEHMRQGLAEIFARLVTYGGLGALRALAGRDPRTPEHAPRVRALAARYGLAALLSADPDDAVVNPLSKLVASVLRNDDHPLPLRLLAEDIGRAVESAPERIEAHTRRLRKAIDGRLADPELPPPVIESLAWARNRLDLADAPEQQLLVSRLRTAAAEIGEGERRVFDLGVETDTEGMRRAVGRALADLSRRDLGLAARLRGRRVILWRGDRKQRRLWRIVHELRRPAPTKRVGHHHTIGRQPMGDLRAPPGRMDEEVPTTVPGERVRVRGEGAWGRHLPTVDDLIGLPAGMTRPVQIFSDFGITTINPPSGVLRGVWNQLRMLWRYGRLAEQRIEALGAPEAERRNRFISTVRDEYGIDVRFAPYDPEMPVPTRVASLFGSKRARGKTAAGGVAAIDLGALGDALGDAFADSAAFLLSWAEGGQPALALFLAGTVTWFVGRARYRQWRIERARAALPLCIGGWGTRGKSGTERLKAGLFSGLGYDVFVKTTGCEAMMMHSVPGRLPLEVFIHRPYDKASIWEQRDMLELAAGMKSEVFLWECMALNPRYVGILQQAWMKDDMATLTNAYPDHEDVQGPAGEDVARVIAEFVPQTSTLITSEENFLPIFGEKARQQGTRMLTVPTLDADLIAGDLLDLFPYDEHPRNIALVARMAEELGLDATMAIHTMALNVVPDLGVLKRYPAVRVRGRRLTFVNGMSANERTGFLNNWTRSGLDSVSLRKSPREMVVTVVNNRADRVPRSEIFARILVEDVAADLHVLIGTNLAGLEGYIRTALDAYLEELPIVEATDLADGGDVHRPRQRLAEAMERLRIPFPDQRSLEARLTSMAEGLERRIEQEHLEAALDAAGKWLTAEGTTLDPTSARAEVAADSRWKEAITRLMDGPALTALDGPPEALQHAEDADARHGADRLLADMAIHARLIRIVDLALNGDIAPSAATRQVRAAWRALFLDRIVAVDNPEATGDQIIDRISRALPPGAHTTVMGIQNIKGTGLDFIYRWVNFEAVAKQLEALDDLDEGRRIDALRGMANITDPGVVGAGTARARLAQHAEEALSAEERGALDYARRKVDETFDLLVDALDAQVERTLFTRVMDRVEDGIDFVDAWLRTRKARRIMGDLVGERMSHERAALEMRALNKRGKGGWLSRRFGR